VSSGHSPDTNSQVYGELKERLVNSTEWLSLSALIPEVVVSQIVCVLYLSLYQFSKSVVGAAHWLTHIETCGRTG